MVQIHDKKTLKTINIENFTTNKNPCKRNVYRDFIIIDYRL